MLLLIITECGCSEAAISSQCNEDGTCMCIEGAVGEKCDECGFEYSGTNHSTYVPLRCNWMPSPKPLLKCMYLRSPRIFIKRIE